jgi:CBS domain-containing protein
MSARAAWRLVSLGFEQVYRYTAGKEDWIANSLPTEGSEADSPRAGDVADRNAPRCALNARVGDVRDRVRAAGWESCIVVNEEGVVLGRVRGKTLDGDPEQTVDVVMESGPTTVRPSEPLPALIERMQKRRVSSIVVTTSDGELIGVLRREDGERRLAKRTP